MNKIATQKIRALSVLLLHLSVVSMVASAHEDKPLRFSQNLIVGLPEKYTPCVADWASGQLKIRGAAVDLPKVFSGVYNSRRVISEKGDLMFEFGIHWRLQAKASWFHQSAAEGDLPDYLVMVLQPKGKDYRFEIVVNLEEPKIVGTRLIVETYSRGDGDVWVNRDQKILGSVTSMEMELSLNGDSASIWGESVSGSKVDHEQQEGAIP